MKSIYKLLLYPLILTLTIVANVYADQDIEQGKINAETCLGCHAIPGYNNVYPTYKVPKLAGQHSDYIISALNAYKNKERNHKTMHANAVLLSDKEIEQIAKYFESIQ